MKKVDSTQCYQTEKAIIDALLKISEIVQKTEVNRQHQKYKRSKKTIGDGDYNDLYVDHEVPMPPPMRTLDSFVSDLNQRSLQRPSNCNQASIHRSKQLPSSRSLSSSENNKQSDKQHLVSKNSEIQGHSYKRHCSDSSSTSSLLNDHRKKSSQHRSNNNSQLICSTTAPLCTDQQQLSSSTDLLANSKIDFDQELQITLEKYLKTHLLSSTNEHIQQQRKTRLSSLIKSEPEKLINQFNLPKSNFNLKNYEKQRELAMHATKQGNYALSYSIYTNLLHDSQYDYKLKSEILSSRATTLLFEEKYFESIDDCTQAIAFNQWNKLAYVVRGTCWMIKHEYVKAVEDYSKLFHFFDQNQYVLDLLNLAYEKSIEIEQEKFDHQFNVTSSFSPTASFNQPAVYLCYPYQT